jgi:hypothetical protein
MNRFPGIMTIESCCGHGKQPFRIWFVAKSLEVLPPLLYYFDTCHGAPKDWSIVVTTDGGMSPAKFRVEGPIGDFEGAERIAKLLNEYKCDD